MQKKKKRHKDYSSSLSHSGCCLSPKQCQLLLACLIFSITGENRHYGTPTNPAVPARVSGGSSSGAAVAVAADLVDFSLGELHINFQQLISVPFGYSWLV